MLAVAAELAGYAGKFRCFLESFLARNELVASAFARFLRASPSNS